MRTVAAAPLRLGCPAGYSGWEGVMMSGSQDESAVVSILYGQSTLDHREGHLRISNHVFPQCQMNLSPGCADPDTLTNPFGYVRGEKGSRHELRRGCTTSKLCSKGRNPGGDGEHTGRWSNPG